MIALDSAAILQSAVDEMAGPFQRGVRDCCVTPWRVFARLHGLPPEVPVQYRTLGGARRLLRQHGGAAGLWRDLSDAGGLIRCAPRPGAIARVLSDAAEEALSLGVCVDGKFWATKGLEGVVLLRAAADIRGPAKWA